MADIGQATFDQTAVILLCDATWTCCQREQCQAKVDNYNKQKPLKILSKVTKEDKRKKKNCQASETNRLMREMEKDPKKGSADNATSPCLAEQMEKDFASGKTSTSEMGVEMDHPVEVKVGGPADTTLKALDKKINNFLGNAFARNTGNNLLKQGETEIESVSLVCNPPCQPPKAGDEKKNYSTGSQSAYPPSPDPSTVSPRRAAA
jgi:hypothetical protein